jgi:bifunctional DNA-binding transcriptional regulator/antitoxin component of YhaV-PrlF toxin-antitoxin module
MMESPNEILELDVRVEPDGRAIIPAGRLNRLGLKPGSRLRVKLIPIVLSRDLVQRDVTEDEIEHISLFQLEPRQNVLKFLGSEGALSADKKFRHRMRKICR